MKKNNKTNQVIAYTTALLSATIIIGTQWFTGTTKREVQEPTWGVTNKYDMDAQIEQYIQEENTHNALGDGTRASDPEDASTPPDNVPEPSAPIDVTDAKSYIWSKLKEWGFTDQAAAAVMGNLEEEAHFDPNRINSIGAYGICQWTDTRKTSLMSLPNYNTIETQINYFKTEWDGFRNSYFGSTQYSKYSNTIADAIAQGHSISSSPIISNTTEFMNATDTYTLTAQYMAAFERPGYAPGSNHLSRRCDYTKGFLNTYGGK